MNNFQQICRLQHYNTAGDQSIITTSYMEVSHWSGNNPFPCGGFSLDIKQLVIDIWHPKVSFHLMLFLLDKGIL